MQDVEIMWGEVKADCYGGESCEEISHYWNVYCADDKQDDSSKEPIVLDPKLFPPGTKITVTMPDCPDCDMIVELCDCGFDWKEWVLNKYS